MQFCFCLLEEKERGSLLSHEQWKVVTGANNFVQINEIVALRGKMPQAVVGKKFGIEQTEVSAIQRLQRAKTAGLLDDHEKKVSFFYAASMLSLSHVFPSACGKAWQA